MKRQATDSPAYRSFIKDRDDALETLFVRAIHEANDLLRRAMSRAVEIVAYRFGQVESDDMLTIRGRRNTEAIDRDVGIEFSLAARHIAKTIEEMNAAAYALALTGEAEAIGRALKIPTKHDVTKASAKAISSEDMEGESIEGRVFLAFSRIRRDIMDAVELARVKQETTGEAIERVKRALPKARKVKRPKKKLGKVTEADALIAPKKLSDVFAFGFVDDETWAQVVTQILEPYVPKWRGPETVFDLETEDLTEEWYGWEVEQYLANEFVDKVRSGEDAGAKQNGIRDMVWIAVIDDKTDPCCAWRDGLTSSEIEKKLSAGLHKDDDCRVIVPPAHFNCRCRMAPLLDVQDSGEFELPASNAKEFDEWLSS